MTQRQLAEKSGFSRSFISLLEANKARNVTFRNLELIFQAVGVQISMNFMPV